jgi:beta-aspartyl-peptidase (threonine type)
MTGPQRRCLAGALRAGHDALRRGAPALAAVEATVRLLEASGLFNAGTGSRLQLDGRRRMDASIMEGHGLQAGAVAGIELVRHPITAARLVLEKTAHVLLAGSPATRLARHFKLEQQPPPTRAQRQALAREIRRMEKLPSSRRTLRLFTRLGDRIDTARRATGLETVGAVALDRQGTVAAGASTGGIALMLPGRVGDSPLIGCGVYADDEAGAVSMTGLGESIMRIAVAKDIMDRLAGGAAPATAARLVLAKLAVRVGGTAGALVLTKDGRFAIRHNTPRMAAGYWAGKGKPVVKDNYE